MKLIIDNIKLLGYPINNKKNVLNIISNALTDFTFDVKLLDDKIVFTEYNSKYEGASNLFNSRKFNKIPLSEGDSRRVKLKRDHLNSRLLTRQQEASILNNIKGAMSSSGISASLFLQEFNDDTSSVIELNNEWPVSQQSYPIEGE